MEDHEAMVPVVATENDDFARMLREILKAIDARIERIVLKHMESAVAEFRVRGGHDDEALRELVDDRMSSMGYMDEDAVDDRIRNALSNCSVSFDY
jgi:hypothetical protein